MSKDVYFPQNTMAEVAESEIHKGIEKGIVGVANKFLTFEFTINKSLPLIERVDIFNFVIDFKDGSVLVLKSDHINPPAFYTQTQEKRG